MSIVLSDVTRHFLQFVSRAGEDAITIPHEVAEGEVVLAPEEGTKGMDVDLPIMEETKEEAIVESIPKTQDDFLSLPNMDESRVEDEDEEEEHEEEEVEEEEEAEEEVNQEEGNSKAEQQLSPATDEV